MRFIEQNFPVASVSESCSHEKSIRHGHISTLQTWWARRPLAVCRATIFLSVIPDSKVLEKNRDVVALLRKHYPDCADVEASILRLTAELSDFSNSQDKTLLSIAKQIIALTNPDSSLIDTFSGGGSIPLESIRLGVKTFASDLNPIATTGLQLALKLAPQISKDAFSRLELDIQEIGRQIDSITRPYYGEENVLAYFWARTYFCSNCQNATPLIQSKWLSKTALYRAIKINADIKTGEISFSVHKPVTDEEISECDEGTIRGKAAKCVFCAQITASDTIQQQGIDGRLGEILYAKYVSSPEGKEYVAVNSLPHEIAGSLSSVPPYDNFLQNELDLALDLNGIRHLWAIQYGVRTVGDLFNPRQRRSLSDLTRVLKNYRVEIEKNSTSFKESQFRYISLIMVFNKTAVYSNKHSWWQSNGAFPANIFVRQAISMVWNYVEIPPSSKGAGGWASSSKWITKVLEHLREVEDTAQVSLEDAERTSMTEKSVDLVIIDPPYFDSITYAYLSDFFYPWMKVLLEADFPEWYVGASTPKAEELIVDRKHKLAPSPKNSDFFRKKMAGCLVEATRILRDDGVVVLMYGHKDINAWLALFYAITDAGLRVTTSWPVSTERKSKFKHSKVDALGISCLLVLRRNTKSGTKRIIEKPEFESVAQQRSQDIKSRNPDFANDQTSLAMSLFPLLLDDYIHNNIVDSDGNALPLETLMEMAGL